MPLETATYIADLNVSNPAHTDQMNVDDSHLRLIKSTIKNTFANFTSGSLSSTQAQIDAAVGASVTNGVTKLADAGAFFNTNTTDGITNPSSGEVDVKCGGTAYLKVTSAGANATHVGPGAFPIGASTPWYSDALPTGFGTYAWVNGQAISRTTYAALFGILGTTYGTGDGTTTFNLPDTRDNVLVGKGTMGSTSAINRITQYATGVIGNLFGECLHLLTTGEMPSHTHTPTVTDGGHTHTVPSGGWIPATYVGGGGGNAIYSAAQTTGSSTTGITVSNANTGGGSTHNNVQPSIVCNWIMRIA